MKTLFAVTCLVCLISFPAFTQRRAARGTTRTGTVMSDPISNMVFLSGKVVTDDGSAPGESVAVQTVCRGQKRTEAHTDARGGFSFQFGSHISSSMDVDFDADTPSRGGGTNRADRRDYKECELQASLVGFRSDVVQLGGRFSGTENADVGQIVLHRLAHVEGLTISATTAAAPPPARKAFEKGQEQEKKNKWDDAQKSFEKAVALYPRFAAAWCELGRVQLQLRDPSGARNSLNQSIAADAKYINPYHLLTQMALHEQNWQEMIQFSEKALALNPINFPDLWLWNATAYFSMQDLPSAEKSARRGLEIDGEHHVPKLEYLLGIVLEKKPDYGEATRHLKAFMAMSSKPEDIAEAQKQLDLIARVSAANVPAAPQQ